MKSFLNNITTKFFRNFFDGNYIKFKLLLSYKMFIFIQYVN